MHVYRYLLLLLCLGATGVHSGPYRYLGCWFDNDATSHDLNGLVSPMGAGLTVDQCSSYCYKSGFPYAGIQMKSTCYCGNTYGSRGPSSDCNTTCGFYSCGGYQANDVYYAVDSDLTSQRVQVFMSASRSYTKARMMCVMNGGELVTAESANKIASIVALLAENTTSVANIWVGLRRRLTSTGFEWTDENLQPPYEQHRQDFAALWMTADEPKLDCVAVHVSTRQLTTFDCTTELPYACMQLPGATVDDPEPTAEVPASSDMSPQSKLIAMYIVLPLFLCCYGGSCIIYCVHKIIRNCAKAKRAPEPATLDTLEEVKHVPAAPAPMACGGAPPGSGLGAREKQPMMFPPKRPLSGKRVFPSNNPPMYIAQPSPVVTERSSTPVTMFNTQSAPEAEMKPLAAPPPYDREEARRARLLDKAAQESRDRRQLSRPGTGVSMAPSTPAGPQEPDTAKLIQESARAEGTTTPQGLAEMSINDILKMKMQQKGTKRKPRKIITS